MKPLSLLLCLMLATTVLADEVDDGIARAKELQKAGDIEGAVGILTGLKEAYPEDLRPNHLLAFLVTDLEGGLARARDLLQESLEVHPRDEWCLGHLEFVAMRALDEGSPEVAWDCADTLRELVPSNKDYRFLWAEAAHRMGDGEAARHACDLLIQDFPSFENPYWLKARTLGDVGRFEDEIEVWQDLLREQPGNIDARIQMAWAQYLLRDYESAEESYQAALDLAGDDERLAESARNGLSSVTRSREQGERLRSHRTFLDTMLIGSAAGWLVLCGILFFATRRRK